MSNGLSDEKKQQILALGKLGWPRRRIEQFTGVRRQWDGFQVRILDPRTGQLLREHLHQK